MAKELPFMKFYPSDFYGDPMVQAMSDDQELIYYRFLSRSWLMGPLPKDEHKLAALARMNLERFRAAWVWPLTEKWRLTGEGFINHRLEDEKEEAYARSDRARKGGEEKSRRRTSRLRATTKQTPSSVRATTKQCLTPAILDPDPETEKEEEKEGKEGSPPGRPHVDVSASVNENKSQPAEQVTLGSDFNPKPVKGKETFKATRGYQGNCWWDDKEKFVEFSDEFQKWLEEDLAHKATQAGIEDLADWIAQQKTTYTDWLMNGSFGDMLKAAPAVTKKVVCWYDKHIAEAVEKRKSASKYGDGPATKADKEAILKWKENNLTQKEADAMKAMIKRTWRTNKPPPEAVGINLWKKLLTYCGWNKKNLVSIFKAFAEVDTREYQTEAMLLKISRKYWSE